MKCESLIEVLQKYICIIDRKILSNISKYAGGLLRWGLTHHNGGDKGPTSYDSGEYNVIVEDMLNLQLSTTS
jgi:hypothetical protein